MGFALFRGSGGIEAPLRLWQRDFFSEKERDFFCFHIFDFFIQSYEPLRLLGIRRDFSEKEREIECTTLLPLLLSLLLLLLLLIFRGSGGIEAPLRLWEGDFFSE